MKVILEIIKEKEMELCIYNNGERMMGDYLGNSPKGKHVVLKKMEMLMFTTINLNIYEKNLI